MLPPGLPWVLIRTGKLNVPFTMLNVLVPMLLPRIYRRDRPRRAAVAYAGLVARIRADSWQVENYQFPLIADERRAGSDLLQRLAGLVEVSTDREVWML